MIDGLSLAKNVDMTLLKQAKNQKQGAGSVVVKYSEITANEHLKLNNVELTTLKQQENIMNKIALIALLVALSGCGKNEITEEINVGGIVSSTEISTSWNDSVRSTVIAEKGSFNIKGVLSFIRGDTAFIRTYENGKRVLCISSDEWCKRVY